MVWDGPLLSLESMMLKEKKNNKNSRLILQPLLKCGPPCWCWSISDVIQYIVMAALQGIFTHLGTSFSEFHRMGPQGSCFQVCRTLKWELHKDKCKKRCHLLRLIKLSAKQPLTLRLSSCCVTMLNSASWLSCINNQQSCETQDEKGVETKDSARTAREWKLQWGVCRPWNPPLAYMREQFVVNFSEGFLNSVLTMWDI